MGSSLILSLGSLDLWGVRWFYPRFVGFMGCSLDYRFLIEKRNNDGGLFSVLCTISIYSWCRAVELFEFSAKIRRAFKACGFRNACDSFLGRCKQYCSLLQPITNEIRYR